MITDLPYILAYREQQQLFLFDWDYIAASLCNIGGTSTVAGRFLVQFFYSPWAAIAITLLCLGAIALLHKRQLPFIIAPLLFLLASLADQHLHFDIIIACIFASGAYCIWQNIRPEKRLIAGIVLTLCLFPLAGSAAFIFVLCTLSLPLIAFYLLIAFAALQLNLIPAFVHALSPVFFYDAAQKMPAFHWVFWLGIPAGVLLDAVAHKFLKRGPALITGVSFALICLPISFSLFNRQGKDGTYNIYRYEYLAVREDWAALEKATSTRLSYPVTANWHYLAKSYQGKLIDDLMKTRHNAQFDLLFIPEDKSTTSVLPYILYRMGNMAAAQNVSYNLLFASCGYNPSLLKMQTKIELMRGNYDVARKYLSVLEKSPHYRKWAQEYRPFLFNDALVEADAELGCGRKDFPEYMDFTQPGYPMQALYRILRANPANRAAMEYALAFLLLSKDIVNVTRFVSEFYGAPALRTLPVCAQEAICFFTDYQRNRMNEEEFRYLDREWCLSHGVEEETIRRMIHFQEESLRNQGRAPARFRGTYWYYLVYEDMMMNNLSEGAGNNKAIY